MRGGAANADTLPLTPALSPPPRKGEGEEARRGYSLDFWKVRFTYP